MAKEIKRSVCPYDCPDTCGLLVEVEEGKALRVKGDPEHPFTRGFLCPKMHHYEKTVHSPLRLTSPLLRTGPKGMGHFRPISWKEALAHIATRWQKIIKQYGAEAILPYSYAGTMGLVQRNSGHPFFHRLGASRLDRTICAPAKEAGWKAVMGQTATPHPAEVKDSDLVILWGINAVATNIHFLPFVKEAQKKGARVWLIETYKNHTAAHADQVFLVRPGTDGALALGLMHLLVKENLINQEFLNKHVQGFAKFKEEILPAFTPTKASQLTGLSEQTIYAMARTFGRSRAPFIRLGAGLSRYGNGAMSTRLIVCLPALVGAYEKKGGGCFPGTFTAEAFPLQEFLHEDFLGKKTRLINMNQLGEALNNLADPPIQSLYVYHSNPAAVAPDQNQVLKGLGREDLFTIVHERFLTDTALYADLVLPATSSLEHPDLYRAYGSYCIQLAWAIIPPVGESKANWEVFCLLADALGFTEPFFKQTSTEVISFLLSLPAPFRQGIDPDALMAGRPVEIPISPTAKHTYRTPSGKIEILNPSENYPLPCYLPPYSGEFPLRLMTAPSLFALNSSFRERDELRQREKGMFLLMHPQDAAARSLGDEDPVWAYNRLGEVKFTLRITPRVPPGVVVAEGIWWLAHCPGPRSVNALTSSRLTDQGRGSTFYDNTVEVRLA